MGLSKGGNSPSLSQASNAKLDEPRQRKIGLWKRDDIRTMHNSVTCG
jgi:hypothetical protein